MVNATDLDLAASTVNGNLIATATTGDVTQSGALIVAGTTDISSIGGDIVLDTATNSFAGSVTVVLDPSNNFTIVDVSALQLQDGLNVNELSVTAANITQGTAIDVGGASSFVSDGDINLSSVGNDFVGNVDFAGANVNLQDVNAINFAASSASGAFDLTAGGDVTQSGGLNVAGATSVSAVGSAVNLSNSANDFGGSLGIAGSNVTLVDSNDLEFAASDITGLLNVTAGGTVTQVGSLLVGDATSITAGSDIILDNAANDFTGSVMVTLPAASDFSITDVSDLSLQDGLHVGNLTVNAANITQGSAIDIDGASNFVSTGNIILDTQGNDFSGEVDFSGTDVAITDANSIGFSASSASGDFNLTAAESQSDQITQTGSLNVTGASNFNTNGDIELLDAGNVFGGAVSFDFLISKTASEPLVEGANNLRFASSTPLNLSKSIRARNTIDIFADTIVFQNIDDASNSEGYRVAADTIHFNSTTAAFTDLQSSDTILMYTLDTRLDPALLLNSNSEIRSLVNPFISLLAVEPQLDGAGTVLNGETTSAIAGAVPTDAEGIEEVEASLDSGVLTELRQVGVYARANNESESLSANKAFTRYMQSVAEPNTSGVNEGSRDPFVDLMRAVYSPQPQNYEVAEGRISSARVTNALNNYYSVFYNVDADGSPGSSKANALSSSLRTAFGKYRQTTEQPNGAGYRAFVEGSDPNAAKILNDIRELFVELRYLGLTPKELNISESIVLRSLRNYGMNPNELMKAIIGDYDQRFAEFSLK